jgi:hypothetical protein
MTEEGVESQWNVTVLGEFLLFAENCDRAICVSGYSDILPWKFAEKEIYKGIRKGLEVVSS